MIYNEGSNNQHWNTKRLSDLGVFGRGVSKHRPRNDEKLFKDGKYPFIQTGEIKSANLYITKHTQEYSDFGLKQSKLWDAGTLCITIAANIAETGILAYPMCFPDSVVGFTAYPDETTEEYMYYIFEYIRQSIQNAASGSIQDNINIEFLTGLEFKVPGLSEQKSIVDILSVLDCSILLNNQINDNLQAIMSTLYDYWFVQFDFPDENGRPYKSSGGKMVWSERLNRDLPAGWEVCSIIDNPISKPIKPGVVPFQTKTYLATADVTGTDIGTGTEIEYDTRESRANMEPSLYSAWFAKMKASTKHLFLGASMMELIDSTILSTGFQGIQCMENSFEYISAFISTSFFESMKDQLAHGATQEAVNNDDLQFIPLTVPDDRTLKSFHDATNDVYKMLGRNIIENKCLQSLRDWLLPMLMNGQATVKRQETNYRLTVYWHAVSMPILAASYLRFNRPHFMSQMLLRSNAWGDFPRQTLFIALS